MQQEVARQLDGVLTVSDLSLVDIPRELGVAGRSRAHGPARRRPRRSSARPPARACPGRILVVTSADVPLKGLMVLLDALAKLRVERPDAHLVCVGRAKPNGPADRRLDELGMRGAVTFRSGLTQEELVELMQSAEVAAVPSFYEGFCLPAVEEMAVGLPLVATRVGALPEIVGSDNEAGLLVPPGDAGGAGCRARPAAGRPASCARGSVPPAASACRSASPGGRLRPERPSGTASASPRCVEVDKRRSRTTPRVAAPC